MYKGPSKKFNVARQKKIVAKWGPWVYELDHTPFEVGQGSLHTKILLSHIKQGDWCTASKLTVIENTKNGF